MNEVVKAYEALLAKLIREDIKLKIMLSNEDCIVTVDSHQIGNVLMNLAANAQDAIPEEGLLTISTEVVEMDNAFIKAHGFGGTEKYVLVSVSETGVGMDESTRLRVFEPFFTTKEVGKCTGLASVWDSKTAQWLYRC